MAVFVVTVDMSRAAIENESVSTTFRRAVLSARGSQMDRESNETISKMDTVTSGVRSDAPMVDATIGVDLEPGFGPER